MANLFFIDFGRAYGPFESVAIAHEYMGEIGIVDAVECFEIDSNTPTLTTPSAEFFAMARETLREAKPQILISLGHSAYSGVNASRMCFSKAQAIRVLRNRGMSRNDARKQLAREFDARGRIGLIFIDKYQSVECAVYVGEMPYGWNVDYADVKRAWINRSEI